MKSLPLILLLLPAVWACPGDRSARDRDSVPVDTLVLDTTISDLSGITANLPPAEPDTFRAATPRAPTRSAGGSVEPEIPRAPEAIQTAAERERSVSQFCYREFGLKNDPRLAGNVGVVVTVNQNGISDVRVGASRWSSRAAGAQVNACLNERLEKAWKVSPGAVRPGSYQLQLQFSGD